MKEVLSSGDANFVGSAKSRDTWWDYFEQSLIKNVRVEAVRNLDHMPTLAGLTEATAKDLLEVQAKALAALQSHPHLKGEQLDFTQIGSLSQDQKDDLKAKGIILSRDKHYSTVVPLLTDAQRHVHHNDKFALMVNYPYEQFRFIANQKSGSIQEAVKLLQMAIERTKEAGCHFGMLGTKSWLCCNLANLGAFQLRMTLELKLENEEQYKALHKQLLTHVRDFMGGEVMEQIQFNAKTGELHVFSRFQLGAKASRHIKEVTDAAKVCVTEYRNFLKANPDVKAEDTFKEEMLKTIKGGNEGETITKEELEKVGDSLVKSGALVSNTLFQDFQDSNPEWNEGGIEFAKLPL